MAISGSVSLETLVETDYFSLLIETAVQKNFAVAIWRLPNDPRKHLIISKRPSLLKYTDALENLLPGFIFAPFEPAADRIFLVADFYFTFENGKLSPPETQLEIDSYVWLYDVQRGAKKNDSLQIYLDRAATRPTTQRDFFLNLVNDAIGQIERGAFEKIVVSRTQVVDLGDDFNVTAAFQKLCSLYSNALISFVSIPGIGSWMGASPELLASVENKKIFRTTALAGTQPFKEGTNLKTVAWTQKDIEEQALVERYIISCFKKIRLREYEEHGPRTVAAGNLIHLKSDFTVDMEATNFPQLGSVMLQLLHPTSAVCGMPLDTSLEFIHKNEAYNRQFYAGYLGPVHLGNSIDIFVNLRCLQLIPGKAILYAGAGITQDSIAEKEWEETELKLSTLLKLIE
jgi:isochorismate synthase